MLKKVSPKGKKGLQYAQIKAQEHHTDPHSFNMLTQFNVFYHKGRQMANAPSLYIP